MSDVRERCVQLLFNFVANEHKRTADRLDAIRDELAAARADERARVVVAISAECMWRGKSIRSPDSAEIEPRELAALLKRISGGMPCP